MTKRKSRQSGSETTTANPSNSTSATSSSFYAALVEEVKKNPKFKLIQSSGSKRTLISKIEEERLFFSNLLTPDANILRVFRFEQSMKAWHRDHYDIFMKLDGEFNVPQKRWKFVWGAKLNYIVCSESAREKILGQEFSYFDHDADMWENAYWLRLREELIARVGRNKV